MIKKNNQEKVEKRKNVPEFQGKLETVMKRRIKNRYLY